MILLPSVLRPHRFPCVLPLAALAVTTVFLAVATGALAQERYRSPDKAVAALVDAMRSEALQRVMRVLGPGSDEIVRNEMSAIDACDAYVTAQKEYAEKGFAGKGVYARRFISRPGERDGLYWAALSGEDESPLGEFATSAEAKGYSVEGKQWAPYQGYYYRILTRQGPNAPGGEIDYMVSGDMVGGFALVAFPARYRSSGLMTFLVNHQGTIYEKDLGWRTTDIALEMTSFDPDRTWRRVKHAVQFPITPR